MKRNTFPLKEHLKSKSVIDNLYANGTSATAFPLRAVFLEQPATQEPTAAILINVAKRRFRHAVDRNLLKRPIFRKVFSDLFQPRKEHLYGNFCSIREEIQFSRQNSLQQFRPPAVSRNIFSLGN